MLPARSRAGAPACSLKGLSGQTNGKLTSLPDAGTRRSHASPVQLHEVAHQCETDAEPRFGARRRLIRLLEQIEYVRLGVGRDTDPGVADASDGLTVARIHPH